MLATPAFVGVLALAAAEDPYYVQRGQEPPAEVLPFVPKGYEIFDFGTGDLDADGRIDALLVLRRPDEDAREDETPRPLLLLVRRADGRLEEARRSDRIVYCYRCGGMMGDPYQGLEIAKGRFTVSHYGGSASRWSHAFTIAWDPAKKDWFLDRDESTGFHATDPDDVERTIIKREELGEVPIGSVDYEPKASDRKRWRVVAERARFYDQPDRASSPRKAYLVKGDPVESLWELRHFVQASFTNAKGESTSGFLLKQDLEPVPAAKP